LVANWHRDQGRRKVLPLEQAALHDLRPLRSELPEVMTETREEQEALRQAIRRLPAERQELLILKFVERLSNAEIGAVMNRSEGAIKSLYHRTLLTLRDELTRGAGPGNGRVRR
jgi:RNA polymerase sigma-70 factor (ECF subfamily)